MTNFKKSLERAIGAICVILFVLITIIGVWQVASRFVFNNPAAWTEETLTYGFTWLALISFALVTSKREHMRLTFVIEKFSQSTRIVIEVLTEIALLIFSTAVFIYGGIAIMKLTMIQVTPALQAPMGVFYGALPVTGVLMDLLCILNIAELLSGKARVDPSATEEA